MSESAVRLHGQCREIRRRSGQSDQSVRRSDPRGTQDV